MKLESYAVADALINGEHVAAIAALARHFGAGELSSLPVIERKVDPRCIQEINIRYGNRIYCWAEEIGFWLATDRRTGNRLPARANGVRIWSRSAPAQE